MRARLVPLEGGSPIDLVKDLTLVGRGEECDLRIDSKGVSKRHCVLVKTDGLVVIRDLGSTNGTRVNGQRVRRGALLPNDRIAFATFQYSLQFGDTMVDLAERPSQANFEVRDAEDDARTTDEDLEAKVKVVRNELPDGIEG